MGWQFTAPDDPAVVAVEAELTAGEWEQMFLLAQAGGRHDEIDLSPTHCPVCRSAVAVTVLASHGMPTGDAVERASGWLAADLVAAFTFAADTGVEIAGL